MKNKKITFLSTLVNWTWELPQTLLGFILKLIYSVEKTENYNDIKLVHLAKSRIGISLGRYILVHKKPLVRTKKHEYGHCRQSKYFGPLYLIIIGLPSITLNVLSQLIGGKFSDNYYNRFPENWADKLGKVAKR